ncbi:Arrestin (or S-antigen), C-terminal domain [Nakaseomyces bracarensis]|uniref:Arrestin (Or S-antigen), C-terminal domain n=1 Tax=Nakaseomyces bracarensis TaxID=273131 RepID=A0ABR4NM54_9SACH
MLRTDTGQKELDCSSPPIEKRFDMVDHESIPIIETSNLQVYINLIETNIFLEGFKFENDQATERSPALLRGFLIVRILKQCKLSKIMLTFQGDLEIKWPENIMKKIPAFQERKSLMTHHWLYFDSEGKNEINKKIHDYDILGKSGASIYRELHSNTRKPNPAMIDTSNDNNDTDEGTISYEFKPGDYVYGFEHPIPNFYPETINVPHATVKYYLQVRLEKSLGILIRRKRIMLANRELNLLRIPPSDQVELGEPIVVDKIWNNVLKYNLIIPSKELILNAFLPIHFEFLPLDKLVLHRIRIYLTENITYTSSDKKVTRLDGEKIFLLSELNGPLKEMKDDSKKKKGVKELGNLLLDKKTGDITNKAFQFNIYVPSNFTKCKSDHTLIKHVIHPDTSYPLIICKHWIKIALRISTGGKHYEVVIDSPIHVLNQYCSYANTLLPKYESIYDSEFPTVCKDDETESHDSNVFYPKEIVNSPILHDSDEGPLSGDANILLSSPTLKSNIYRPENIRREMTSPQAVPMFTLETNTPPEYTYSNTLDTQPPSYDQTLNSRNVVANIPHLNLNESQEQNCTVSGEEDITSRDFQPTIRFRVQDTDSNTFLHPNRRFSLPANSVSIGSFRNKFFRRRQMSFDHITNTEQPRNLEEILASNPDDIDEDALESPPLLPTDSSVDIASLRTRHIIDNANN